MEITVPDIRSRISDCELRTGLWKTTLVPRRDLAVRPLATNYRRQFSNFSQQPFPELDSGEIRLHSQLSQHPVWQLPFHRWLLCEGSQITSAKVHSDRSNACLVAIPGFLIALAHLRHPPDAQVMHSHFVIEPTHAPLSGFAPNGASGFAPNVP